MLSYESQYSTIKLSQVCLYIRSLVMFNELKLLIKLVTLIWNHELFIVYK